MTPSYSVQVMTAAPANANAHSSDAAPAGIGKWFCSDDWRTLSVEIVATGIDAADGAITLECSNLPDPTVESAPPTKSGTSTTLTAAGSFLISLGQDVVTERWYRVAYAKGSNTMGTIDAYLTAKG